MSNRLEKGHSKRQIRREIDKFCEEVDIENITVNQCIQLDKFNEKDLISYIKISAGIVSDMLDKIKKANEILVYKKGKSNEEN